jgi:hypothetical protein
MYEMNQIHRFFSTFGGYYKKEIHDVMAQTV